MTYTEFVKHVAERAALPQATVKKALDNAAEAVGEQLRQGDEVAFANIGKFRSRVREAGQGRNPHTGETIQVPAKRVASFAVGAPLKRAVNE